MIYSARHIHRYERGHSQDGESRPPLATARLLYFRWSSGTVVQWYSGAAILIPWSMLTGLAREILHTIYPVQYSGCQCCRLAPLLILRRNMYDLIDLFMTCNCNANSFVLLPFGILCWRTGILFTFRVTLHSGSSCLAAG